MIHTALLPSPLPSHLLIYFLEHNWQCHILEFCSCCFLALESFSCKYPHGSVPWCLQFFQISPSRRDQSSPHYLKLQPIPLILDFFTMLLFIPLKYHDTYLHTMFILSSLIYKLNKVEIFLSDFFTSKNFHKHSRHIKMLVRMNYLYIHLALSYLKISSWCMWSKQ